MPNAGPDLCSPTALAPGERDRGQNFTTSRRHAWANAPVMVPVRKPGTTGHTALSCARARASSAAIRLPAGEVLPNVSGSPKPSGAVSSQALVL